MRTRPGKERAASRLVNRYHKLYEPRLELVQSLEDVLPAGGQLSDTIELTTKNGELLISGKGRPVRIVLHDKERTFVLEVGRPRIMKP
jgi:hypothetical protein